MQDKPAEKAEGFSAAEQAELEEAPNDLSSDEEDAQKTKDAAKAQSKEQKRVAKKQKKEDQKQQKLQEQKQKKRNRELHALANKANRYLLAPLAKLQKAKDMAGKSKTVSDMECLTHQQLVEWHSAALALVLKAAKNPSAKLDELPFASFQDLDAQVKEYLGLAETVKTKGSADKASKKPKAKAKATAKATTRKRKAEQLEENLEGDADKEKNGEDADESKNAEDSEEAPFEVEPAD